MTMANQTTEESNLIERAKRVLPASGFVFADGPVND